MRHIPTYAEIGNEADKPVVVVSPTAEPTHERIAAEFAKAGMPLLRGLRPGLAAVGNLSVGQVGKAGTWARAHRRDRPFHNPSARELRRELSLLWGSVPAELCTRILRAYGLPFVRSVVVKDLKEAVARAHEVGFPMAVKIASRDILHRSDVGGVMLGINGRPELESALGRVAANVTTAAPHACIDGFELQEQFQADAEAMIGFAATPPFGSLLVVGTGGTMVELHADRAVALAPVDQDEAAGLIAATRLGKLLAGYRNLLPETDTGKLAELVAAVSRLAADLGDLVVSCDLNPVLIRKGSGEVRLVDALMLLRGDAPATSERPVEMADAS
jgi:acyl-CoA synthetase (NDP forming)